jgi:hypothetical protein
MNVNILESKKMPSIVSIGLDHEEALQLIQYLAKAVQTNNPNAPGGEWGNATCTVCGAKKVSKVRLGNVTLSFGVMHEDHCLICGREAKDPVLQKGGLVCKKHTEKV